MPRPRGQPDPDECASWDYKRHPGLSTVARVCGEFEQKIRNSPDSQLHALTDTSYFHRAMFRDAVPTACDYLAGNYRGSDYACLKHRNVAMGRRRGAPCEQVASRMASFHTDVRAVLAALDSLHRRLGLHAEFREALIRYVALVVSQFQDIHPYADGNGHVARLLVWVIMGHFFMVPRSWWLHENPGTDWDERVALHQRGHTAPLEDFLYDSLLPRCG